MCRAASTTTDLDPCLEVTEGGHLGDVVDEDHGVDVAVVVLHHGLPETLLTSGVPYLNLANKMAWCDMLYANKTHNPSNTSYFIFHMTLNMTLIQERVVLVVFSVYLFILAVEFNRLRKVYNTVPLIGG